MRHVTVRFLEPSEHKGAGVRFYETQGYEGGIAVADIPLGAWEDEELVGLVRLAPEQGLHLLRGMFIHARVQRQGIGTRMLIQLQPRMQHASHWLVCPDRLNAFYGQVGFHPVDTHVTPPHLLARAARYQTEARGTMNVLRRPPASEGSWLTGP